MRHSARNLRTALALAALALAMFAFTVMGYLQ
jgi:hypothetical protein